MSEGEVRHFSAILERVESAVQFVAEGHGALKQDLGAIGGKVDRLGEDMNVMGMRLGRIEMRMEKLDQRMERVEGRTERLEADMHEVKDHLGLNGVSKPAKRRPKKK